MRKVILLVIMLMTPVFAWAQDKDAIKPSYIVPIPKEPTHINWLFTGLAATESGAEYGYFFIMQQENLQLRVKVGLFDQRNNQQVFYYEHTGMVDNPNESKWKVGKAFLRHNLINESWVFGVKNLDNKGFNFKVDMLQQIEKVEDPKSLRNGIEYLIKPINRLNGHIVVDNSKKEQFVIADSGWFVKSWLSNEQVTPHKVRSLFCRMNDGSGFYSTTLQEADANHAALANWTNAQGNEVKMSQFVAIDTTKPDSCHIKMLVPKFNVTFANLLANETIFPALYAGFFKGEGNGFCLIHEQIFSRNIAELEARPVPKTVIGIGQNPLARAIA